MLSSLAPVTATATATATAAATAAAAAADGNDTAVCFETNFPVALMED